MGIGTNRAVTVLTREQIERYNREIYGDNGGMSPTRQGDRFTQFCVWGDSKHLREPEFLLDQVRAPGGVRPFSWEQPLKDAAQFKDEIAALGPWEYHVEFGDGVGTRQAGREPYEYDYHRYRGNLFPHVAASVLGGQGEGSSVIDVACHCGVIAMEFAVAGFSSVRGVDLRTKQVDQAKFLARAFSVGNVEFVQGNVRELAALGRYDVVFCGGLMYHVTFPMELVSSLYESCREFLILDTIAHREPMSGFHLVCDKNVNVSTEGEFHYELQPTYRAVIDALYAVGFKTVLEIVGLGGYSVPGYREGYVKSFLAFRPGSGSEAKFIEQHGL